MKRRIKVGALVSLFLLGISATALYANIVLPFGPDSGGGVPAYARIERLSNGDVLVHNDGVWAAITFYRDPACVPAEFDLLNFFDAPRAFDCILTVEGFEVWRNGPWSDSGPIQTVSHGLGAVPIWFVKLDELQTAIDNDGELHVDELANMPSLKKGSAVFFKETLHPSNAAQQTKTQIVALGILDDGGPFFLQVEETHDQLKHVRIEFN